jgi:gas vesicle protein
VGGAETSANKARRKRRGGFIFGALAGAVAGLMLAPRSGKETRAQLFGEGGLGAQVDRVKGAVGAGKDSAADQSEALKRKIEETRERLRRQVAEGDEDAPAGDTPLT